ncbi:MAG: hypothetical protein KBT11_05765 [Treponema sp.]|nr:hypothetical protein [Candidatus Treponema equifaecale]
MKKSLKRVLVAAIFGFASISAFAHGKGDTEERSVENMESWQETFDINEKTPGKYNVYVEAKDKGGNTQIAGPYNLFIDPDSDYAISGVTNPAQQMRVPGNLNIVGTCVDDDGVAEVWLVLDGAEPVKASGKEYWSYYLDTTQLAEGPHTIEVWGVDINGLSSQEKPKKKAFVTWNLDRRQPVTQVTNYQLGTLVSGKISLKGTVYDGNGIKNLYYSLDNGTTYNETKIAENKKDGIWTFDLPVDTRLAEDGPAIIWFKAIDKMGSVGIYSFLYFIDNTKPDVKIVSPEDKEVCNGRFGIAGYAKDKVGLQKLTWAFDGKTGEFELIPGNPYWFHEVDTRGMSGKAADFVITATDTAGNVVQVKKSIPLNQEDDKPVVTIQYPVAGGIYSGETGTLFVRGIVNDDDGVASVEYSLDGGAAATIESQGVFSANIELAEPLSYGTHKITAVATDIHGVKGNPVTVTFNSMGAAPKFAKASVSGKDAVNGLLVHPESNPVFETSVSSSAGLNAFSYKVEYGADQVYEEKDVTLKAGDKSASVKIPLSSAPWGLVRITLSAKDVYERTTVKKCLLNLKDLTYIHEDLLDAPFAEKIVEGSDDTAPIGVTLVSIGGVEYKGGMNVVVPYGPSKTPVIAVVTLETEEKNPSVSYTIEGDNEIGGEVKQMGKAAFANGHYEIPLQNLPSRITTITIKADGQKGVSGNCKGTFCVVRPVPELRSSWKNGEVYMLPDESAVYDAAKDVYIIEKDVPFTGYANISGPVTANLSTVAAGLAIANENKSISVSALKDGLYKNVVVTARDGEGHVYNSKPVNLLVDSEKPVVEITAPANHLWVQKSTQLSVTASDANGIAKVEYSLDNQESWTTMSGSGTSYSATLNLANMEDGLIGLDVRATDGSGKVSVASVAIQKDTTPPEVKVLLPGKEDIVNGENLIAFIAKDNGKLVKAEYLAPNRDKGGSSTGVALELAPMIQTHIGTRDKPISDLMSFKFTDAIGNVTELRQWDFIIDNKSDLPIAEVHLPAENAVITTDFTISGVIYDDDGIQKDENGEVVGGPTIWFKFDNGKYEKLDQIGTSFSIAKKLTDFTDNEHSITVYAEDINGVTGPEYKRNFRISLEEPKGAVQTPPISETVKETVKMTGIATDKNGIQKVYISVDNGNSFNEAIGKYGHENIEVNWSYEFDTRVVQDGTHVVFLKIVDWYGIEGLYSSLINIDNTKPTIDLELPMDDSTTTGMVFVSGQTTDNIGLKKLYITIRSLDGKTVSANLARTDLVPDEIITQAIDLSSLSNGSYNVEISGVDAANNITRVSRNVTLNKDAPKAKVDLLYPLNGEHVQGVFNIYGTAVSEVKIENLTLFVDGKELVDTQLTTSGYFKYTLNQELLAEGEHKIRVEAKLENGTKIVSNEQYIEYQAVGPWITIDSFTYGDFAVERPYIIGNAGYSYDQDEVVRANAKGASKEMKDILAAKTIDSVELSLDNGKTFEKLSNSGKWRYRVENEDIAEGYHFLLVRVTMKNGEKAVTRCIVQVDSTKPVIKLISPGAGGKYNQKMVFSGLAHDDVALKSLTLALRKGDKASYEVPAFIQGLYFDWQFWGAELFDIGAGLTFFDDNVKLQVQWGQFTQQQRDLFDKSAMRYGGDSIIGMKLLANVYYLPFRYYFGPDWEWLSLNVAVGANFSSFNGTPTGKRTILSAGLVQLEFPRVTFAKQKMFRTISFYTEGQFWFIPTDVSSEEEVKSLIPQISFGMRVNVF